MTKGRAQENVGLELTIPLINPKRTMRNCVLRGEVRERIKQYVYIGLHYAHGAMLIILKNVSFI